jgi:hypothetical protein
MKSSMFFLLVLSLVARAQVDTSEFDAVTISREEKIQPLYSAYYNLEHPSFKKLTTHFEMQFQQRVTESPSIFNSVSSHVLVSLFGGSWSTESKMQFWLPATLRSDNKDHEWRLDVFVNGSRTNTVSRKKFADGSSITSGSEDPMSLMAWSDGAWAVIRDRSDTVARLRISLNPGKDSLLNAVHNELKLKYAEENDRTFKIDPFLIKSVDHLIYGEFRNKPLIVVYFSKSGRGYILMNNRIEAIVHAEKEKLIPGKKKNQQDYEPALWLRKGTVLAERSDLIMLAASVKCLSVIVRRDNYMN